MKTNFLKISVCILGLFIYSQTNAQQSPKKDSDAKQMIEKLDADKDGKISLEEAEKEENGKIKAHFKEIDTNEDGFVELEELKKFHQEKVKEEKESPEKY